MSSNCFFFKHNTAYEMRISDWSSDVCSSDLVDYVLAGGARLGLQGVDLGKNIRRQAFYAMEVLSPGHFRGSCGRRRPPAPAPCSEPGHRKSVGSGKSVSVRVDIGGSRIIKNKKSQTP